MIYTIVTRTQLIGYWLSTTELYILVYISDRKKLNNK